jgi:hypothetical protein
LIAATALVSCGGSDDVGDTGRASGRYTGGGVLQARYRYPARVVRTFVDACGRSSAQRKVCGCTIERLESTLPYPRFAAADQAIRAGLPVPRDTRAALDAATEACRE